MRAEDLLSAVFPAQLGCQDNRIGNIEPPDHPLVSETIDNCLREAMDLDGAKALLAGMESGAIATVAVETPSPSPLSHGNSSKKSKRRNAKAWRSARDEHTVAASSGLAKTQKPTRYSKTTSK